jgi:hypothetical protein
MSKAGKAGQDLENSSSGPRGSLQLPASMSVCQHLPCVAPGLPLPTGITARYLFAVCDPDSRHAKTRTAARVLSSQHTFGKPQPGMRRLGIRHVGNRCSSVTVLDAAEPGALPAWQACKGCRKTPADSGKSK